MYTEARKIHLIEELLKVDNDATLTELETVIKKAKKGKNKKASIYDFVGVISTKNADKMRKAIEETSEIIHEDDWK